MSILEIMATEKYFTPRYWRKSQARSFEQAEADGAVHAGTTCTGISQFKVAMFNACNAVNCMEDGAASDDMMVRVEAGFSIYNQPSYGDFPLAELCGKL